MYQIFGRTQECHIGTGTANSRQSHSRNREEEHRSYQMVESQVKYLERNKCLFLIWNYDERITHN